MILIKTDNNSTYKAVAEELGAKCTPGNYAKLKNVTIHNIPGYEEGVMKNLAYVANMDKLLSICQITGLTFVFRAFEHGSDFDGCATFIQNNG